MQRSPNFQQNPVAILPPLMIPIAQFFDAFRRQINRANLVTLLLLRQAVLEAIQFHREPGCRTVEIEEVDSLRVLAAKLESGKTSPAEGAPEFLFLIRLVVAKSPRNGGGVHG